MGNRFGPMMGIGRIKALQYPLLIFLCWVLLSSTAWANIVPDSTLPQPTITASPKTGEFVISGGTRHGRNLFYSFESLSVPDDCKVIFQDTQEDAGDVDLVISRVTGDLPSSIDGLLQVAGEADLFLINPNGFRFGPHGQLDLQGSFVGTTAESIEFEGGLGFSTVDPGVESLLSTQRPTGLRLGERSGRISVQNQGNEIDAVYGGLAPVYLDLTASDTAGLQVPQGETLALVGAGLVLEGGIVSAPNGQIYLGSVESGVIQITPTLQGWRMNSEENLTFGDILLTEDALVNVSDADGTNRIETPGIIDVQGASVTIEDGSLLVVQHQGAGSGDAAVSIQAAETLTIDGAAEVLRSGETVTLVDATGILVDSLAENGSRPIEVLAQDLILKRDSGILSFSFDSGNASAIDIRVLGSVLLEGGEEDDVGSPIMGSFSYGLGKTGDIDVNAGEITLLNGGAIATQTNLGEGNAGDIRIDAGEVTVTGAKRGGAVSVIASTGIGGLGSSGGVVVSTERLLLSDGGVISSAAFGPGSSGNVTVEATESIIMTGDAPESNLENASGSGLSAAVLDGPFELFGFSDPPLTGTAGDVIVTTPTLTISDGALISVFHEGGCETCNAGDVTVTTNELILKDGGRIDAFSASGLGGDIVLDVKDTLILQGGAEITATARGESSAPENDVVIEKLD